ncbi:MAG: hypothetical protein E7324_03995 [Clostridiales bacterium]|nr:hypothetical protein [Clostridiales bacterium]
MKRWMQRMSRCYQVPGQILFLLSIFSAGALTAVFLLEWEDHPLGWVIFALSFCTLVLVFLRLLQWFPQMHRRWSAALDSHPLICRFIKDLPFRERVLFLGALGLNLLFAVGNGALALMSRSAWFGILSGYYCILSVIRFLLVWRKRIEGEWNAWKRARLCAAILTLMNLVLAAAVPMMMYLDRGFHYPGILIYAMAAYTFFITITGIVQWVRAARDGGPLAQAVRMTALVAALISMLALETAMLTAFGEDMPLTEKRILLALSGGAIALTVLGLSGAMIVRATKKIEMMEEKTHHAIGE